MEAPVPAPVTALLEASLAGDATAREHLWSSIYDELRRIAQAQLKDEAPHPIVQTTVLVHEAYLRLVDYQSRPNWTGRAHFFALAARVMRQILVDWARGRQRVKRGGLAHHVSIESAEPVTVSEPVDVLALNDALERLTKLRERCGRVVELRYFAGLRIDEVAGILNVAERTVNTEWEFARTWLARELGA